MKIGTLFWVLMILWLLFGLWGAFFGPVPAWHPGVSAALLWVLLALLGWQVFGPMLSK